MTLIDIHQTVPDGEVGNPEAPAKGYQTWTPTGPGARRRADNPDREVREAGFRVDLLPTGVTTIEVAPTDATWVWVVYEYVEGTSPTCRAIAVPDVPRIDFRDCPQVDPRTLAPLASPDPIWVQQLAALTDEIASAQAHEEAAELAARQAAGSASSAAASASAAEASERAASVSATAASGAEANATTKASEASASASAASGSASSASGSAASAATKAGDAETARDAAVVARTAAEAAAGTSTARAGEASDSASTATTQAGIATTKAGEAAASAASAAATLANAVTKTTIDAKGDLLVGSANDTIVRLPAGSNGAILMADSNAASGLSYQSPMPLLVNLLTNSDFSNGTTGWIGSNATVTNVSNEGVMLASAVSGFVAQLVSHTAGRRYYFSLTVRGTTAGALLRVNVAGLGEVIFATTTAAQRVTTAYTASSTASYPARVLDTRSTGWDNIYLDSAVLIDLTACFGAGKEPSKDEMDAIMARYPNSWFAKETPQLLPTYDWLKLTQGAATNLVQNGDFSAGTTNWSADGVTHSVSAGTLTLTSTSVGTGRELQLIAGGTVVGHKYYGAADILSTSTNVTFAVGLTGKAHSGSGAYERLSLIHTATASAHVVAVNDMRNAGWDSVGVRNVMAVDLTATFGAGNEPTKSEIDYLLSKYPNSWFNGTVNDLVARYDSRRRIGTGSPEGVVTAPVGTEWTDIAATNGAIKWVKSTGTGSTGWTVVVGDTGWRDISTLLISTNFERTAGSLMIRRVNETVSMKLHAAPVGAKYGATTGLWWDVITAIPLGFRLPDVPIVDTHIAPAWIYSDPSTLLSILQAGASKLSISGSFASKTFGSATRLQADLRWASPNAWPTTLPGTPG